MRRPIFFVLVPCLLLSLAAAPAPPPLTNPGFEEGAVGEAPPGWSAQPATLAAGYTVRTADEKPESGAKCLEVALPGERKDPNALGNVSQTLDATPFRGKRVRFSAAARMEGKLPRDTAALWMRVDREGGLPGFFDNMGGHPITAAAWARYQIIGDVAADAKEIKVGLLLPYGGRAWLDSARFEVVGEAGFGNEAARPLSDRGLENLVAFTRLFGDVRYFHPSDQVAAADWEAFALAGVQRIEKAQDAAQLAGMLDDLFRPVAPTVRIYPTGHQPPLPEALEKPAGPARTVAWRHFGLGNPENPSNIYKNLRVDDQDLPAGEPARAGQDVDATPYRGKKVRLRAAVRAELPEGSHAGLWLAVFRPNGEKGFEDNGDHPLAAGPWREASIIGDVAADAQSITVGLVLDRRGKVWIDDVSLEIVGDQTGDPHRVVNPSFEEGEPGWQPDAWEIEEAAMAAGYSLTRSAEQPHSGAWSGLLASADPRSLVTTQPDEPLVADLGGGVSALIPLALWADAAGTLPHGDAAAKPAPPGKPEGWIPSGDDRATRLADVVLAWNVFQHFYPYFDIAALEGTADWSAVLRVSLREAAADADDTAFRDTMRHLVAALHDGHGAVSNGSVSTSSTPPLAWDWIEDNLVVTWVDASQANGIRPGDAILSLDGKPAREAVAAAEARYSAATPQYLRARSLTFMAAGPKDQEVKLEIRPLNGPLDGPVKTVTVRRTLPFFGEGSSADARLKALPEKIAEVRPGIFYVDISRITDADFKDALDRLAAAKGVVFDLRGYPSHVSPVVLQHLSDHALHSAQWNIPVLTRPDQQGVTWIKSRWTLPPLQPRLRGKIAFLTGGGAISYAESYMGIVEAYKLAAIVGGPTAGTNGNINPFVLPGGYRFVWTGMKVLKHDGSRHHGVGIQPTVPVSPTRRGVAAGKDEVLEKGLEVVGG